jgi:predicted GIY-YIG superfamily endonuclease
MYHLYYLTATTDDRIYIGITNNPDRRYYEHINYTIEKNHYNGNWIRKTLDKGGQIKMNIMLSDLSKRKAIELEIKFIEMFKKITPEKITNTAQGGLGFNHKGIPHSEEHKKSIEMAQPHKVRIPKKDLYDLYVNQKLSKKKIGQIYGCGATTIDRRLLEYGISARTTPNYKVSYKLDKEKVLDMFLNQRVSILKIAEYFNIGQSGIRYLLQREGIDTMSNKFSSKLDVELLNKRFIELKESGFKKMKIYEELALETGFSKTYLSKLKFTKHNL